MDLTDNRPEAALLGSLLIEPELAGAIFERVRTEDFLDASLRHLAEAARSLWLERRPVDPVTVQARAGDEYNALLAEVMRSTPTAANWESYADAVRDRSRLQSFRNVAFQVLDCRTAEEARQLLAGAQGLLAETPGMRVIPYVELMQGLIDRINAEEAPDLIDWGFPALNQKLLISHGRFVVLAAESSVGKTALALQLAVGMARGGKRVGFFSLETSGADAADRIAANTAGVSLPALKKKRLKPEAAARIIDAATRDARIRLDMIEAAGSSVDDIRALTLARGYDVIFVDYVQLINAGGSGDEPSNQVRSISMGLHTMALQLGVTVIGLSQVTPPPRGKDGKRPELSRDNLRESRQLIHDAEAILIMDLSDLKDYGSDRILKVDKNKDGPCGRMTLRFEPQHMRFVYESPQAKMERKREEARAEIAKEKAAAEGTTFADALDDGDELPF